MYKLDNNVEWTEELKNAFKTGTTRAKIIYDGDKEINETNALKNLTIKDTQYIPNLGFIGQACSKELSFSFVNTEGINLENKEVIVKIGAEYNGDVYYITYGNFIVSEAPQNDKTNNVTNVVANDYMIKFDVPYEDTITYPCTLKELVENICEKVGVELGSESFSNQDFIVVDNQFENNVAREVIKNAAKCAFSWARIGQDNKLYFDFEPSEEIEIVGSNFTITNANPLQGGSVTEIKAPNNSITVEGTNLTITDADSTKKAEITEMLGDTIQEGTPTPETPVEVETATGDNNIVVSNKNLFVATDVFNGYITGTGALVSNANNRTVILRAKPNTTYTIQAERKGIVRSDDFILSTDINYPSVGSTTAVRVFTTTDTEIARTFTTRATDNWIAFKVANISNSSFEETLATIQLEERNTSNLLHTTRRK